MNGKTISTALVAVGITLLLVAAGFGTLGYAALVDAASLNGPAASGFLAPAEQAAQPTAPAVNVSSQGGGVVSEVQPAVGQQPPTPVPVVSVAAPAGQGSPAGSGGSGGQTSGALPVTGQGADPAVAFVLWAVGLTGVALVVTGLWLRNSRRRGQTL